MVIMKIFLNIMKILKNIYVKFVISPVKLAKVLLKYLYNIQINITILVNLVIYKISENLLIKNAYAYKIIFKGQTLKLVKQYIIILN